MAGRYNGGTATYVYNALGERAERNVGGTYTEYLYDKDGSEVGENNRTSWTETWAAFQGRHLFHFSGGSTYFTHMDSLGTTSIVTDYSTGAVVQDDLHYSWGPGMDLHWMSRGSCFVSLRRG